MIGDDDDDDDDDDDKRRERGANERTYLAATTILK
jgi:uncharacterized membrane protein YidH (DUF202 family)